MREAQELHEATEEYCAAPLEDNLFEWHFTVQGPPSTDFEGGVYHGRILLPPEYPMKPPNIILLTVSKFFIPGIFSISNKKYTNCIISFFSQMAVLKQTKRSVSVFLVIIQKHGSLPGVLEQLCWL